MAKNLFENNLNKKIGLGLNLTWFRAHPYPLLCLRQGFGRQASMGEGFVGKISNIFG
jgi:hypothetical protein